MTQPPTQTPTDRQIRQIAALSREIGWTGLTDLRLRRFAERTLKFRFIQPSLQANFQFLLSRKAASQLITGLENFASSIQRKKS